MQDYKDQLAKERVLLEKEIESLRHQLITIKSSSNNELSELQQRYVTIRFWHHFTVAQITRRRGIYATSVRRQVPATLKSE